MMICWGSENWLEGEVDSEVFDAYFIYSWRASVYFWRLGDCLFWLSSVSQSVDSFRTPFLEKGHTRPGEIRYYHFNERELASCGSTLQRNGTVIVFTFIALKKIEQPPVKKNKNWYQCSTHKKSIYIT